ncbi:pseudouridine synthase [Streptococcus didelphis]|uniref:Pseudouridine synthase n=1 Tax=Streptococcus didelphis TaxID=102886 RepID=A0ABY9LIZ6_9STRE|nr:pseudouridine synthase [Streptococcus didelphis]WMB28091.1 pseudouridine synthase [Streptococcus didelphis]WMB30002.1 pseudouridine synthase [Streptococcus didelphis]
MRLDKLLEKAKVGSRSEVKKLLKTKKVLVDGVPVINGSQNVDTGLQKIVVHQKHINLFSEVYYILNKPSGFVTARSDAQHKTVLDLLAPEDKVEGLYPVGRLDRDTEGLLLLTNNGPLGFSMLHPKQHVEKTYYVEVNGFLASDAPAFFSSGIVFLDGTRCRPAQLNIIEASPELSRATLHITEGKFHQVKKMFLSYGLKVIYLQRISFGDFNLGSLELGSYRQLTEEEKAYLKAFMVSENI